MKTNWTTKQLRSGKYAVVARGKNVLLTNRYGYEIDKEVAILAAAAPELLHSLEELSSEIEAIMNGEHGSDWADHFNPLFEMLEKANKVIAKAYSK
jgi:hypothetical protein